MSIDSEIQKILDKFDVLSNDDFELMNSLRNMLFNNGMTKSDDVIVSPDLVRETINYKGFIIQRLTKDMLWYVTKHNKIVNWSSYRNDMKSWIDKQIKDGNV